MFNKNQAVALQQKKLVHDFSNALKKLDESIKTIERQGSAKGTLGSGATLTKVRDECIGTFSSLAELIYIDINNLIDKGVLTFKDDFIGSIYQNFLDEILKDPNFAIVRINKINRFTNSDRALELCVDEIVNTQQNTSDELLVKLKLLVQELEATKKKASRDRLNKILDGLTGKTIWLLLGLLVGYFLHLIKVQ